MCPAPALPWDMGKWLGGNRGPRGWLFMVTLLSQLPTAESPGKSHGTHIMMRGIPGSRERDAQGPAGLHVGLGTVGKQQGPAG